MGGGVGAGGGMTGCHHRTSAVPRRPSPTCASHVSCLHCWQVQGLMYIFDCDWCNLYIWTPQRGSAGAHAELETWWPTTGSVAARSPLGQHANALLHGPCCAHRPLSRARILLACRASCLSLPCPSLQPVLHLPCPQAAELVAGHEGQHLLMLAASIPSQPCQTHWALLLHHLPGQHGAAAVYWPAQRLPPSCSS